MIGELSSKYSNGFPGFWQEPEMQPTYRRYKKLPTSPLAAPPLSAKEYSKVIGNQDRNEAMRELLKEMAQIKKHKGGKSLVDQCLKLFMAILVVIFTILIMVYVKLMNH